MYSVVYAILPSHSLLGILHAEVIRTANEQGRHCSKWNLDVFSNPLFGGINAFNPFAARHLLKMCLRRLKKIPNSERADRKAWVNYNNTGLIRRERVA